MVLSTDALHYNWFRRGDFMQTTQKYNICMQGSIVVQLPLPRPDDPEEITDIVS